MRPWTNSAQGSRQPPLRYSPCCMSFSANALMLLGSETAVMRHLTEEALQD